MVHVSGLSKSIAPVCATALLSPLGRFLATSPQRRGDCWSIKSAHGAHRDHDSGDGSASKMIEAKRTELGARQTILRDVLSSFDIQTLETSPHARLHLPEPRRGVAFTRACRERGVGVLPMEAVGVGPNISIHAVRIPLGTRPRLGI